MTNRAEYKTKQQEKIKKYLSENSNKHLTVQDIHEHFNVAGESIGTATIYRCLDRLVQNKEVQKYTTDSAACYQYIGEDRRVTEHFHLKCTECSELIHMECDFINELGKHIKNEHEFVLNPQRTTFYGVCKKCMKKHESEEKSR